MKLGRVGSDRPPEGELGRKIAGSDCSALGLAGLGLGLRKKKELGRGQLTGGCRDRGAAAATVPREAVLAPGRRGEGRNGRR
ncbi:hypothetical protein CDL15_Pgr017089 [Punica granatum]|uniref:Uncharacterized protein n=1 Tax=Punica granatum TaxID=22663 RepID=A0A218WYW0_PUNGR|nr:hypothetical protein CDL15_Pgr017089 [Punica granatum]